MIQLLVEAGADVNARTNDTFDYAPVHSAGLAGHFDVVELLRALGATGPPIEPIADLLGSADVVQGEKTYTLYCNGCHGIEKNGPAHLHPLWGVLGRDKASVEGVRYSEAFQRLFGKWTLAELNAFIASPVDHVPGTKMRVKGLRDPMERANLIAFLLQNSDDPPPLPLRP
jgi:cytochrome c